MRISVSLPRPGGSPHGSIEACVQVATTAETHGLHAVSATDHPFPWLGAGSAAHQAHDPFTLLAFIGAQTRRVRLQFSLLVNAYRNPFLTARMLATLDQGSTGRVMATFGAGYLRPEFAALGAHYQQRGSQIPDAIGAMKLAWAGSPVHNSGPSWEAAGNIMAPGCFQEPHPPLWRGGNATQAIEQAATAFDGWAPLEVGGRFAGRVRTTGLTLAGTRTAIAGFHDAWDAAGRSGMPDACLVRTRTDWLVNADRIVTEVGTLAEHGFTWIELTPPGNSISAWSDGIAATATALCDAGLLHSD